MQKQSTGTLLKRNAAIKHNKKQKKEIKESGKDSDLECSFNQQLSHTLCEMRLTKHFPVDTIRGFAQRVSGAALRAAHFHSHLCDIRTILSVYHAGTTP